MNAPRRSRACVLTPEGLKKLREQLRSHEIEENSGYKYTLERLGELTGLNSETVKNVLDCKGSDKRTIARCFESFGLMLEDNDHIPATQASVAIADPNFVGRDQAIADLKALVSRNAKVIVIQAKGGVGKTTLARKYLQQEFGSFLEFPIAKETKDIASIESLIEEKLRQLGEEPGREFLVSLDRLKRKLQNDRIGILIDNLEPALDSAGKFIEAHRRYVELLRVLSDPIVKSMTLITSRERLREADITVQHYSLKNLDVQAWEQFFQSRSINTETPVAALHSAYGGNAKAMDIISGVVLEDFSGDVGAYWQANQDDLFVEQDLEDLVKKQFDRLQQLNPDAYKLLCRMGCYRYQDVPTIPIEGLFCLLWDVPENRHRRVIKSLQDRSLIEFENNDYWLHSVIRSEGIKRLILHEDWEIANKNMAHFLTNSVQIIEDIGDALIAFEAYYHFVAVEDWDSASEILIIERTNKWFRFCREGESLGWSFYRLGLFQKFSSIDLIKNNINAGYPLSKIYSLLGIIKWATGEISESVKNHNMSRQIAKMCQENDYQYRGGNLEFLLDKIETQFLINMGFCKISLHEFKEAEAFLEQAILLTEGREFLENDHVAITCYLTFVKSCLGLQSQIHSSAASLYLSFEKTKLGIRGRGYGLIFLASIYKNLGDPEIALELYLRAIDFARESHYLQVEAKALNGLASVYRDQRDFKEAEACCSKAIEILEPLGVKSDLAETRHELGLIYQLIDEFEKSQNNFKEAIRLFDEMEAPKQVERVRRSMQNEQ